MREPSDADVLALVRTHWSSEVDRVERLHVGSGARHWQGLAGFRPLLFITFDMSRGRRTPGLLEAAYSSAAELAFRLDFVVAGLPSHDLTWTVPVADGALSVTPWVMGEPVTDPDQRATARMLARLHAAHPPRQTPRWRPVGGLEGLAGAAEGRPWVVTHGRPLPAQIETPVRTLLASWKGLRLAPRERDLHQLVDPGPGADPEMLALFDEERRLEALTDQ